MAVNSTSAGEVRDGSDADRASPAADGRTDGVFDRIVVAVDGDTDERVAQVALSVAASHGARVDALSVVRMNASVDHWDVVVERREGNAETALETVEDISEAGQSVAKRLRYGDPAEEIALYAEGNGADLVVVGEPTRTGLRRFLSPKSVTDRVRKAVSVPVLTVPPADAEGSGSVAAAFDADPTA